jgi:hypothetical protein
MGPRATPRSIFRSGDIRLFCDYPHLKDQFPNYFEEIPVRLVSPGSTADDGEQMWSYEDLRTGETPPGRYNAKCFSLRKLTEMEVLAWTAKQGAHRGSG